MRPAFRPGRASDMELIIVQSPGIRRNPEIMTHIRRPKPILLPGHNVSYSFSPYQELMIHFVSPKSFIMPEGLSISLQIFKLIEKN